jgi:deoxyribose-phosphate aldolase
VTIDATTLIACLDLTDLSAKSSDAATDSLCRKAQTSFGPVASVCVWPQMVSRARSALKGTDIRITTVAAFPYGEDEERILDDITEALGDGADEIETVFPWKAFLHGETNKIDHLLSSLRDVINGGRIWKVILETDAFPQDASLRLAAVQSLRAGADFLATATGTLNPTSLSPTSLSLNTASSLLEVIKAYPRPTGFKLSGTLTTPEQAIAHAQQVADILGEDALIPARFRMGSSDLLNIVL